MKFLVVISILLIYIFIPNQLMAKKSNLNDNTSCDSSQRQIKSCLLNIASYSVQFNSDRFMVYNRIWRGIHPWPHNGAQIEWEKVRVFEVHGRWLIEAFFWLNSDSLIQAQSLLWMIFEFKEKNGIEIIESFRSKVRTRKQLTNGKFIYDKWSSYSLNRKPSGLIEANVNGRKHSF